MKLDERELRAQLILLLKEALSQKKKRRQKEFSVRQERLVAVCRKCSAGQQNGAWYCEDCTTGQRLQWLDAEFADVRDWWTPTTTVS